MTRPGIEPRSLAPLVNILHCRIYKQKMLNISDRVYEDVAKNSVDTE